MNEIGKAAGKPVWGVGGKENSVFDLDAYNLEKP